MRGAVRTLTRSVGGVRQLAQRHQRAARPLRRGGRDMDAPANTPACLVLAGFCFLLGLTSQLLRALAERSEAAWGGREFDAKPAVRAPRRQSGAPAAACASSKPRPAGRSALAQLRAAGEAAWGGGPMPAALDDEAHA